MTFFTWANFPLINRFFLRFSFRRVKTDFLSRPIYFLSPETKFLFKRTKNITGNFNHFKSFHSFASVNSFFNMEPQEKILLKAFDLFKRYGIRSVTMDEIAGQCGVSKKTVYQYFEDKEALVASIMEKTIMQTQEICNTYAGRAENAIHEVFLTSDFMQEMMEGINPALLYDLRKYYNGAYNLLEKHKQEFIYSLIKTNLERGISEGIFRDDIKIDIITRLQLHMMTMTFEEDIFSKSKYTVNEIDYELKLHCLYGLATLKGLKLIEKYKQQRLKQQSA
jgi:AcrR family transcriptional regulator